jgi:negative regulator of flagellin synthesis FlgM
LGRFTKLVEINWGLIMNINNKGSSSHVEQAAKVNNFIDSGSQDISKKSHTAANKHASAEQISSLSKTIDNTFEDLASKPDVDFEKVAKVKAAIANGELSLDQDTLINALLEFHKK